MSSIDKEKKYQYLAHQISFLKEAKLGWTSAVESYTNQVINEVDAWLNDPSSSKTFTDMTNLAHRAVILLTERSQEIQNLSSLIDSPDVKYKENFHITSRPIRSNNHDIKNIQSRLESVENVISSLRATTKLLRDKQKKIDGWAQKSTRKISTHQNFVKNRAKKFFIKLKHIKKENLENKITLNKLAECVAALEEKQTSDGTIRHESNISESELNSMKEIFNNQNKITDDWKENFNSSFHKLSSDFRSLDENYQNLSAQMDNLQEIISSIKNNEHSSKLEDGKNYKEMELKYGMLCQMLLKKVSSVEKFQVAMNQKLGQTAICPNQQKLDQVSCDLESATKALTDLKHAFDTLSARIDSWPPPQPPPQFMPPPPPHPFHHDHHHRRHHHRHC